MWNPHGAAPAREDICVDRIQIKGWRFGKTVFESHTGVPTMLPKHAHDTYQIGITTRCPGEYVCEGKTWSAPPGTVILFNPGDVHSTSQIGVRNRADTSKLMFIEPEKMTEVAASIKDRSCAMPVFEKLVIQDKHFIRRFSDVHALFSTNATDLEKESRLLSVLVQLIAGFASRHAAPGKQRRDRSKALLVREYVEAHYCDNISMATLAEVAHTSPYHLNRVFAREIGIPPHAFQTQVRIERAKLLLLKGMSVAETALSTGFFDQSHLTRYFKRIVGVSPRSYLLAR
jgi:AraC-like DNA-binding protein